MLTARDAWRRWFGALFLIVAAGMVVWGTTVLDHKLNARAFVMYWSTCFALTGLAVFTALIDAFVMRKRTREQHRELFRKTFDEDASKEPIVDGGSPRS